MQQLIGWRTWSFSVIGLACTTFLCYSDKLTSVEYLGTVAVFAALYGVIRNKKAGTDVA